MCFSVNFTTTNTAEENMYSKPFFLSHIIIIPKNNKTTRQVLSAQKTEEKENTMLKSNTQTI